MNSEEVRWDFTGDCHAVLRLSLRTKCGNLAKQLAMTGEEIHSTTATPPLGMTEGQGVVCLYSI